MQSKTPRSKTCGLVAVQSILRSQTEKLSTALSTSNALPTPQDYPTSTEKSLATSCPTGGTSCAIACNDIDFLTGDNNRCKDEAATAPFPKRAASGQHTIWRRGRRLFDDYLYSNGSFPVGHRVVRSGRTLPRTTLRQSADHY